MSNVLAVAAELATLQALTVGSCVGFSLALIAAFAEHTRWRRARKADCPLDVTCPVGRRLGALTFDIYRAIAVALLWDATALVVMLAVPALARVPVVDGTFTMATSTAFMFEGGLVGVLFFLTVRLGEYCGLHRWQQPA